VLVISWIRFFAYFLVIKRISKLLMTLVRIIWKSIWFMFCFICYLMIMTTIFTMLFESPDPTEYGSLSISVETLYAFFIGNYDYITSDGFVVSGSILIMIHKLISSIFLMNFLIAILSDTYEFMLEAGEFEFKRCKYEFIEKYSIALRDEWGYSELVIHPPPLNFLTFFMIPGTIKGSIMLSTAKFFAKLIFWCENSLFIFAFFMYELVLLLPVAYLRVMYNIVILSSKLTLIPLELFWLVAGPFYLLYVVFKDTFYLAKILCDY
jgi:hypothetical protein